MTLARETHSPSRVRSSAASAAVAAGAVACSTAAYTLVSPPGPSARLSAAGGEQSIPILVLLLAGAIIWAFGAAALAAVRVRFAPYVAAATVGAGAIGITMGAPLIFGRFGVLALAGAVAVLGGVILVGGGLLARGIASSR